DYYCCLYYSGAHVLF
nr:immunoglobulin light chain junction region [Macaca mulatta]